MNSIDGINTSDMKKQRSNSETLHCTETLDNTSTKESTFDDVSHNTVKLKRQLNLLHGVGIISGLIVGGGIYISPKGVIQYAGSSGLSLILWGVGGFISMLGALTYAEIGVTIPSTGEKYAYLLEMYGDFIAFLYLWAYLFLVRIGSNAVKCLIFGRYVLKPFFPDCEIPSVAISLLATIVACFGTLINCISVKLSARSQSILTTLSYVGLTIIVISGIVWIIMGGDGHHEITFEGSTTSPAELMLAIYSTSFAFYGWSALNFVIEELKRPERNLPLAIIISVIISTVLYVLVNFTYLSVIGADGVLTSQAVAISVSRITLGRGAWIMPVLIALTAVGSLNAGTIVASRFAFAGAKRDHLPKFVSLISIKCLTPLTALIMQLIITVLYIWTVELYTMINNTVFVVLSSDLICVIGFIRMRQRGTTQTAFRLPLAIPIAYSVLLVFLVCVPLVSNPVQSGIGVFLSLVFSVPYYFIFFWWSGKPKWLNFDRVTLFLQRLLFSVMEGQ